MTSEALDRITADAAANEVLQALSACLNEFATYEIEAKKTSLHVTHGSAFLGVHPRKAGLHLTIVTDARLSRRRIKKVRPHLRQPIPQRSPRPVTR